MPQIIDEIGGAIDFVILDTVHYNPGELFDFPVMLPYLKDGSIVVLHDLKYNHYKSRNMLGYATPTLFTAVIARVKFLNSEFLNSETLNKEEPFCYPNIGAFKVDKRTRRYIENTFLSLLITWAYIPDNAQIKIYREFYEKHYPAELVEIFNEAFRLNSELMAKRKANK